MKFLKISNSGTFDRRALEFMGYSSKRGHLGDDTVLGHKGSGTKFAAVAALRFGMRLAISSSDDNGPYYLTFEREPIVIESETRQQVVYVYYRPAAKAGEKLDPPVRVYPKTLEDAFPTWCAPVGQDDKKSYKILRELACNAYDADKSFDWAVVESAAFAAPGRTVAYLEYTAEVEAILKDAERYLKFMSARKPLFDFPTYGEIYPKSEEGATRFFLLGRLADCDRDAKRSTVFDYSIKDKKLENDEGAIQNIYTYRNWVGALLEQVTDPVIAERVLAAIQKGEAKFEEEALWYADNKYGVSARKAWLDAAHRIFGEKIALPSGNVTIDSDVVQLHGCSFPTSKGSNLFVILDRFGVPHAEDIRPKASADEYVRVPPADLDAASMKRFNEAFLLLARHFPARAKFPIVFYLPTSERLKVWGGFAQEYKEIWVPVNAKKELGSTLNILRILNHEARHCASKAGDYDRKFMNMADEDIVMGMFREDGKKILDSGEVVPELADASKILPVFADMPSVPVAVPEPDEETVKIDWESLFEDKGK